MDSRVNRVQDPFGPFQSVADGAQRFFEEGLQAVERIRGRTIQVAQANLPEKYAYLVERVCNALPEVFAALGALFGGILVVPALVVSWGRKVEPAMPMIKRVIKGEFSSEELAGGISETFSKFKKMFDDCLVPALFVAMVVDGVASFVLGYLTMDMGKMLHASTIAIPGAFLAAAYMLNQEPRFREERS